MKPHVVSHRRVYLVKLLVLGNGVVDSFLDSEDMLLIVQVAGSFPSNMDPSWYRQSRQVHSCSRLRKDTHLMDWASSHINIYLFFLFILFENVNLQRVPEACFLQHWSVCADQTEHSCSSVSACSLAECAAHIPWKEASWRWPWHSLLPELSSSDDTV